VVELDEQRASLRRHDLRGVFDDAPEPVVGEGLEAVVLDLAERWQEGREGLRARTAARLDLPHLRFAALHVEVELEGEAELLLEREGAPPYTVVLGEERIALGSCELERGQGALRIERAGTALVLGSGSRSKTCAAPALLGHVGVALRTLGPATIAAMRVERL
jgi:hypothetical protein